MTDPGGVDAANADRFLAAIVEGSDDAIIGQDLDGIVRTWNAAAELLYGYSADEIRGQSIRLIVPVELAAELQHILQTIREGRRIDRLNTRRVARDGRLLDVSLTVWPVLDHDRQVVGAATIAGDLTASGRDDTTLRASEQRWHSVIESAVDGIVVIDGSGLIEVFNASAERLFGYREEEVVGRNVSMLMPPPYREEHDGYLSRYLSTAVPHIIGIGRDVTGQRRDGTTFPMHLSVGEMRVEGQPKFTGIIHDLTERIELVRRLTSSEARWRSIIESAVDAIIVIDARGRIESFNPAAERLFGYLEDEMIGRNVNTLMPSPDHEAHDGYLRHYLATGEHKIIGIGREVMALRRDGTTVPVQLSVGEMVIDGERKFTGILHDLSVRLRIEEKLREQSTMARLGEMAAVVAHEVKNPLAGIRGAVQVIGGRMPADSREAAVIHQIVARIDGLNGLVEDLLVFARPPKPRLACVDLAGLVATTVESMAQDPAMAGVRTTVEGTAPPVMADVELLKIVVANLMLNSAQAMEGGGTIGITLRPAGELSAMVLHDSGPGIAAEVRARVFTPFFTTKARGTGLGLPTARQLVDAHGGSIELDCPPAGGTVVTILLPAAPPEPAAD